MKASEFYNDRTLIETFGRSKTFQTCRRMREVWPGFPQYLEEVSEYTCAWLIFIMAKTGKTTTRKAVEKAILSGKKLKSGNELFFVWLGNLLTNPEKINDTITTIWIFEDADFIQVNKKESILVFQGSEKVKSVSRATQLSAQFLYELAVKLSVTDRNDGPVFEDETTDEEFEEIEKQLDEKNNNLNK